MITIKGVLSRGLAPRTSGFANRRAETNYTLRAIGIELGGSMQIVGIRGRTRTD